MKTVVLGLFDELDDARRVLDQLASSPLDLGGVEVIRRDVASQMALAADAGLRGRRGPWAAIVAGALLGATAGALVGQGPLSSLGPLLALAAGLLLGALAGAALAGFSDTLRVPPEHAEATLHAVESGATAIVVRTDNLPTARAIGDLFRACGSRALEPVDATEPDQPAVGAAAEAGAAASFAAPTEHAGHPPSAEPAGAVGTDALPPASPPTGTEAIFAPPWRRGVPQADVEPAPSPRLERPAGDDEARRDPFRGAPSAGESDAPDPVRFDPRPTAPPPSNAPVPPTKPESEPADEPGPRAIAPGRSGDPAPSVEPEPESAASGDATEPEPEPQGIALAEDADIILLGLAARHARALRDAGVETVGAAAAALASIERGELTIPGIGPAGIRALGEHLDAAGVSSPRPRGSTEGADVRSLLQAAIRDVRSERE